MLLQVNNISSEQLLGGFSLQNISFTLAAGNTLAVIGETGTGKSTLLKTIAGLEQHETGEIIFNSKICRGPNWQLISGEEGIAYLSQHFELRNNYRMEELLQYNNELTQQQANTIYEVCEITHLMKRNSYQLSGGEKQRIAFARLLVGQPKLMILDEPFSNLDFAHAKTLKQVINTAKAELGITFILTSHNPPDVLAFADEIIVLHKGAIIQQGKSETIYFSPINEYAAGLLGEYTIVNEKLSAAFKIAQGNFLRPNAFSVGKEGVQGIIKECVFLGATFQLTVEILGETIQVLSAKFIPNGETVFLSVNN
jgi:ABC-type sulfate/molybdate transport systems ATPase subunit